MLCQEAFEAISAASDGELAPEERTPLDHHLAGCPACQKAQAAMALLGRRLRGAALEQAPPPAKLQARITKLVTPARPRRIPFVFGFALVGASATLAAFAFVARARPGTGAEAASTVAELAAAAAAPAAVATAAFPCQLVEPGKDPAFPVAHACAQGGVPAAKLAMQQIVARAQGRGVKVECRTCHRDEETFELRDDARVRLRDLLPLTRT